MEMIFRVLVALSILSYTYAECLNACSQHGTCGAYDMCTCDKNFMANDCSQRICQFGVAHSDNAKGDLNADGVISDPTDLVVINDQMYPFGTTEKYPAMKNSLYEIQPNTAHAYMECSNKGTCDRTSGTCVCFDGYAGSACQRTVCPSSSGGECSGHGQCRTIEQIADLDGNNVYRLWDKKSSMGCVCDAGYSGIDCSQKMCKQGFDPLYQNGPQTVRYTNVTYSIFTKAVATVSGNYSLIVTDSFGKTWTTKSIKIDANCDGVTDAIESLPNKAFPVGSILCQKWASDQISNAELNPIKDDSIHIKTMFTLAFSGNPGFLPQLRITKYTEGSRATLTSNEHVSTLNWHIFANGFIGEDYDFVPDLCEGLIVDMQHNNGIFSINLTPAQTKILKRCLGDANGDSSANIDVENWQHGSINHPHLIKLIDANQYPNPGALLDVSDVGDMDAYTYPKTTLCSSSTSFLKGTGVGWCPNKDSPGFYAALIYNGTSFDLLTRGGLPYLKTGVGAAPVTTQFYIFTTTGYLSKLDNVSAFAYNKKTDTNSSYYLSNEMFYGNVSETGYNQGIGKWPDDSNIACSATKTTNCISKNDYVMFLNHKAANNPIYPNLYQVTRVGIDAKMSKWELYEKRHTITLNYGVNSNFYANGISNAFANQHGVVANIYKFTPPMNSYLYAAECSTRGLCDTTSGICTCFAGYTGDNCDHQNALAL